MRREVNRSREGGGFGQHRYRHVGEIEKMKLLGKEATRDVRVLRCVVLVGAFCFNVSLGVLYSFATINIYVASYMRHKAGHPTVGYADVSSVYATAVACVGLFAWCGGRLADSLGRRRAALCVTGGLATTSLLASFSLGHLRLFIAVFGGFGGICQGLGYSFAVAAAYEWWPNHKGAAGGFVLSGVSLSPFIIGPVLTALVNPDNLPALDTPSSQEAYFDQHAVLDRVPHLFYFLAALHLSVASLGALCLRSPSLDEQVVIRILGEPEAHFEDVEVGDSSTEASTPPQRSSFESSASSPPTPSSTPSLGPMEAMKDSRLWIVWVVASLQWYVVNVLASYWKVLGQTDVKLSDGFLAFWGNWTVASSNTLGRLVWGRCCDSIGFRRSQSVLCLLGACFLLSFRFVCRVSRGPLFFLLWLGILFFCVGGTFCMPPMAVSQYFGTRHFSANFGLLFSARLASAALCGLATIVVYGGYGAYGLCRVGSCFLLLAILLLQQLDEREEREEEWKRRRNKVTRAS